MVKEIDGYLERKRKEEKEAEKFQVWFSIASKIFTEEQYKIEDCHGDFNPQFEVYFKAPNEPLLVAREVLEKTDSKNRDLYNSLVDRVNTLAGFYAAVFLYPLSDSIEARCPEVYQDARRLARELEARLRIEVSLKTTYPTSSVPQSTLTSNSRSKLRNFLARFRL